MTSLSEISIVNGRPHLSYGAFPKYGYMDKVSHEMKFRNPFNSEKYISVAAVLKTIAHPILTPEYNRRGLQRILAKVEKIAIRSSQDSDTIKLLDDMASLFATPYSKIKPWHIDAYVEQLLWDKENTDIDQETMGTLEEAQAEKIAKEIHKNNIEAVATNFTYWNDKFQFAGSTSLVNFNGELVLFEVSTAQKVSKAQIGIKLAAALGGYAITSKTEVVPLPNDIGGVLMHFYNVKASFTHYENEELNLHKRHFLALKSIHGYETSLNDIEEI